MMLDHGLSTVVVLYAEQKCMRSKLTKMTELQDKGVPQNQQRFSYHESLERYQGFQFKG